MECFYTIPKSKSALPRAYSLVAALWRLIIENKAAR